METWKKYVDEANEYSRVAFGAFNKSKLGSEVVYNLLSMAIENYLTALCISAGSLPEHSGITTMLKQVGEKMEVPDNFTQEARFVNRFMNFCSLEVLETLNPSHDDLVRMLSFTDELKCFSENKLYSPSTVVH